VSLDNNCPSRGKKKSFAKEIVPIAGDANIFVFWYFICCLQNKKKIKKIEKRERIVQSEVLGEKKKDYFKQL
jgi:hypothetical protein